MLADAHISSLGYLWCHTDLSSKGYIKCYRQKEWTLENCQANKFSKTTIRGGGPILGGIKHEVVRT